MNDATNRALRTLFQMVLGQIGSGALTVIWNSFNTSHKVDPTLQLIVGLVIGIAVSFAHNYLENTGAIKPVLKDAPAPVAPVAPAASEPTPTASA